MVLQSKGTVGTIVLTGRAPPSTLPRPLLGTACNPPDPSSMEQLHLVYLSRYQVILCQEHGYCITPKNFRRHLWDLHAVKGDIVRQAVEEIQPLDLADPATVEPPPPNGSPISGLTVRPFFRCLLPDCDRGATACSQRAETVRKHQAKDHSIGVRKRIKPTGQTIEQISMQSFFLHPFSRWFQVQGTPSSPSPQPASSSSRPAATPTEDEAPSDCMQQWWRLTYAASQESWQAQFQALEPTSELHQSQTPPWLVNTGIAAFLEGLPLEKSDLFQLRISSTAEGKVGIPLEICMQSLLTLPLLL